MYRRRFRHLSDEDHADRVGLRRMELAPSPGYIAKPVRAGIALAPSQGLPVVARRIG